ncbi:MAG: hypothetical protein LBQ83_07150 [Candidatus Margulisbacteria bacterium]|nr:hypothetical protein [Candidatus Margulisiibacteriota bacterium]
MAFQLYPISSKGTLGGVPVNYAKTPPNANQLTQWEKDKDGKISYVNNGIYSPQGRTEAIV